MAAIGGSTVLSVDISSVKFHPAAQLTVKDSCGWSGYEIKKIFWGEVLVPVV